MEDAAIFSKTVMIFQTAFLQEEDMITAWEVIVTMGTAELRGEGGSISNHICIYPFKVEFKGSWFK